MVLSTVRGITFEATSLLSSDEEVDQCGVILCRGLDGDPKTEYKKVYEDRDSQNGVLEVAFRLHQCARVRQLLAGELCLNTCNLRFHDFTLA